MMSNNKWIVAVLLIGLVAVTHARESGIGHQVLESDGYLASSREGWSATGEAPEVEVVKVYLALRGKGMEALEARLAEVSDPRSAEYGRWLGREEALRMTAAEEGEAALVEAWLREGAAAEVSRRSPNWIEAQAQAGALSRLLGCTFLHWRHSHEAMAGRRFTRCDPAKRRYTVPAAVAKAVAFVGGVYYLPSTRSSLFAKLIGRATGSGPDSDGRSPSNETIMITPAALRSLYRVQDPAVTAGASASSQAVHEFEQQYYLPSDLAQFQEANGLPPQPVARVLGADKPQASGEGSLDVQYLMGMGVNVTSWYVILPGGVDQKEDPFLEWIILLMLLPDAPYINAISYGDDEYALGTAYIQRVSQELMTFTATGRTLFFSSGDYGVNCLNASSFIAHFPASSPYVTAVGGTTNYLNDTTREVGISFSGGGFSFIFSQPSYQSQAVQTYLKTYPQPPQSYYRPANRGYPDISAVGSTSLVLSFSFFLVCRFPCITHFFFDFTFYLAGLQLSNC